MVRNTSNSNDRQGWHSEDESLVYDILLLICTQLPLQKVLLGYDVGLVQVATVSNLTTCRQGVLFQTRLGHFFVLKIHR